MRIEPRQIPSVGAPPPRAAAPVQRATDPSSVKPDALRLSDAGARARRVQAAAADAPEARAGKVADLKAQIQAVTYQVDNAALAEKLVDVV